MVKFSKQMELQLVPEWRHKFCDYWQLKKVVKRMKLQRQPITPSLEGALRKSAITATTHHEPPTPLLLSSSSTWTPLTNLTRRTLSRSHDDIIKVHQRKLDHEEGNCGYVYETQVLEGAMLDGTEKEFFKILDDELNKVNHFFITKEREFLERAEILSRQLVSLREIRQAYNTNDDDVAMPSPTLSMDVTNKFSHDKSSQISKIVDSLKHFWRRSTMSKGTSDSDGATYKAGMECEENSRHPLKDLPESDAFEQDNAFELSNDAARAHIALDQAQRDPPKDMVKKAVADVDEEDNWALDGLFSKDQFTSVSDKLAGMVTSGSDNVTPKVSTLSTISAVVSQIIWEDKSTKAKKGMRDRYVSSGYTSTATARSFPISQASFKSGRLASLKRTLSTSGDGLDENCVSLRKIKHARKMLRTAFVEFYRGLGLLRTFTSLNILAFAKILKKYDKVTGRQTSITYMKVVEKAHFNTSDKVSKMMDEVERLFTEHFAKDDEKKAMMILRPVQTETPHTITFFIGLFTGSSVALFLAFATMLHYFKLNTSKENQITHSQTTYQVFGMLFLVLLHMYLYGWNIYAWRKTRINYAFIFEFAPKTELRYREVLLVCTGLTSMIVVGMLSHLVVYASTSTQVNPDMVPLVTILALLSLLLCPLDICYRSSRVYFLGCLKRVVFSPMYKVLFADFFLADQLTSQVAALRSMQFVMCYYFGGFFQIHNTTTCGSSAFRFLAYLISFLPYWWRLMQCLRRWVEEGEQAHLQNGGKYLSAMVAAGARISYSFYATPGWLAVFVITSSFATLYQMYWDVVRDWGFFQPHSHNPWLRDQLILKNKCIYYVSIALNFVLRFAWLQQVTRWQIKNVEHNATDLFFAALEVIRRGHWNFYRLENEHLNNVGKYRAVKLVPLPFRDEYDTHT